jgi:phosphatidylglycerol lysyltransferase
VPLPLVEAAHFIGSVAGLAMLVVARGLLQRLDAAWWAAFLLAIVAAILALPKGIALSEAAFLTALALLLLISRREFNRRSTLFTQALSGGWLLAVACVIAATVALLLFAYREIDYHNELWWRFEFDAHAPRSLRAVMGATIAGLGIALWQLLRHSAPAPTAPTPEDLARAAVVVDAQPVADASLVLMGDKHLLFAANGTAFLMYGRQGRSWISLFDPVGPTSEWQDLIWRFIEMSAESGGRAAFYQIRPHYLPLYLDAGLHAFKLGEYASVPLHDFSLKGSRRAGLRHAMNRASRDGLTFSLVPAADAPPLLPALQQISQAWLGNSHAREKGFSLGAFDEHYLTRQPIALVRQQDKPVAFANIMCTSAKVEASIDLMRHLPDAPPSAMDFLFIQLMLHYQSQGFQRFGLGMAPMSGMISHQLAPRWQRFGRLLFDHGERFYNFRGLRGFKEKFDPVWEPRYLAAPRGFAALRTLADITSLIGGGLRGVIAK